jgi:membrane-associated phospholipid phosphatase
VRSPRFGLRGRRVAPRNRLLAALGRADHATLKFLRTRGHHEPVETMLKALGTAGEYGIVWAGIGAVGASIDERRRSQWVAGALAGPLAIGINFVVKLAVGRERPLIEEHPPLGRAPSKLSFPSAHATSSVAAATALGRVEPRARPALFALAAAICVGRPYLGMHYPSDVLAGAALGAAIGSVVPGLGATPAEERLFDLAAAANERARGNGEVAPALGATDARAHPA